jgi:hypothetical protein
MSGLFSDVFDPDSQSGTSTPTVASGGGLFDDVLTSDLTPKPAKQANTSPSLAQRALKVLKPIGEVVSMPARGLGMLATEAQEALAGTPREKSRIRIGPGSTFDAITGSDVTSPSLGQTALEGYKAGAEAAAGLADVTQPGALHAEDPVIKAGLARGNPNMARAEAVAEPIGEEALNYATDPAMAGLGALGKAGTIGRVAERVIGASFVPGMAAGAVEHASEARRQAAEHGVLSPEALRAGVTAVGEGVMAGIGARHAFAGHGAATEPQGEAPSAPVPDHAGQAAAVKPGMFDSILAEEPFTLPPDEPLDLTPRAPDVWPATSPYPRQTAPLAEPVVDPIAEREFLRPDPEASVNTEQARLLREARQRAAQPITDAVIAATSAGGPPRLREQPEPDVRSSFDLDAAVRRRMQQGQTVEDVQREALDVGATLPPDVDVEALRIAGNMPGPPGRKWRAEEVALGLPDVRNQLESAERPGVRAVRGPGQGGPGTGEVIGRAVTASVKPMLGLDGIQAGPKEIVEAIDKDHGNELYKDVVRKLRGQAEEQRSAIDARQHGDAYEAPGAHVTFDPAEFEPTPQVPTAPVESERQAGESPAVAPTDERASVRYAYRARDIGEQGVPAAGHAQATASEADVRRLAPSRSENPQEVVRVDLSKLSPSDYDVISRNGGAPWVRFKRPLGEHELESRGPVTEIDRAASDKATPEIAATVEQMADSPRTLAKRAGLNQAGARKGVDDVRADGVRELSPEAVAVKRAALEQLSRHGEMTPAGPRQAAFATEAEARAAHDAAHDRAGRVAVSLDLPPEEADIAGSANHPAESLFAPDLGREEAWRPAGFGPDQAEGALGGDDGRRADRGASAPAEGGVSSPRRDPSSGQLAPGQDVVVRAGGRERPGVLIHTGNETETTGPAIKGKAKVRLEDGRQVFVKPEDVRPAERTHGLFDSVLDEPAGGTNAAVDSRGPVATVDRLQAASRDTYGAPRVQTTADQVREQMKRATTTRGPIDTTAKPPAAPFNLERLHLSMANKELVGRMYEAAPDLYQSAKGGVEGRMTFDDFKRQGLDLAGRIGTPEQFAKALKNGAPLDSPGAVVLAREIATQHARALGDAKAELDGIRAEIGTPRTREQMVRIEEAEHRMLEASLQKANFDLAMSGAQAQAARTLVAFRILAGERGPVRRVIEKMFRESC